MNLDYILDIINLLGTSTYVFFLTLALLWFIRQSTKQWKEHKTLHDDEKKRWEEHMKLHDEETKKTSVVEEVLMIVGSSSLRQEIVNDKIPLLERDKAFRYYEEVFHGNGSIKEFHRINILPKLAEEFSKGHD